MFLLTAMNTDHARNLDTAAALQRNRNASGPQSSPDGRSSRSAADGDSWSHTIHSRYCSVLSITVGWGTCHPTSGGFDGGVEPVPANQQQPVLDLLLDQLSSPEQGMLPSPLDRTGTLPETQ